MTPIADPPAPPSAMPPQLRDGTAALDILLSELNPHDVQLCNAALDLRAAVTAANATAAVNELFRVRALLRGRHRAAFQRVFCWIHGAIGIEVRANRARPWQAGEFPPGAARLSEVINAALAMLTDDEIPACAQVRFVFHAKTSVGGPAAHPRNWIVGLLFPSI